MVLGAQQPKTYISMNLNSLDSSEYLKYVACSNESLSQLLMPRVWVLMVLVWFDAVHLERQVLRDSFRDPMDIGALL